MEFKKKLLLTPSSPLFSEIWKEGKGVLGTYSPEQFALRLSPEIHQVLAPVVAGVNKARDVPSEVIQAYSTYLHETIHWWQHIGSTSGFIFSLATPVQFHANYKHLKEFLKKIGGKMPIWHITSSQSLIGSLSAEEAALCNTIVNNYMDIDFFYHYQFSPKKFQEISESSYFECLAHSFEVAYGNTILTLKTIFFDDGCPLPDPYAMREIHRQRADDRMTSYYYGSPILIPPLGVQYLFEAQARFSQMQYLYFSSGGKFGFERAKSLGMLSELYVYAFELYLNLSGQPFPEKLDDPSVNLFLLVCDISINPTAGFPVGYTNGDDVVVDNSPGIRFFQISSFVKENISNLLNLVRPCDRGAYVSATDYICDGLGIDSPMKSLSVVGDWAGHKDVVDIMSGHSRFQYSNGNLPIKFLFAHFVEFCESKFLQPDFFCWPAYWLFGERAGAYSASLLHKHEAPFINTQKNDGIYPRLRRGIKEKQLSDTLTDFYSGVLVYDLSRQWISGKEWFKYDQSWLSEKYEYSDIRKWVNDIFESTFGVSTEKFEFIRFVP